jgi:exodeoxyribonuclease-3
MEALRDYVRQQLDEYTRVVIVGDFNIAPEDQDVHDPDAWREQVLCSTPERQALQQVLDCGLADTFRLFSQEAEAFSWWDYRMAAFRRNRGLRIDLILANDKLCKSCVASYIDKAPRGWERPSDHAPVIADFKMG